MSDLLKLSISETISAIAACAQAGVTSIVFGPPGIGKTSILGLVAEACKTSTGQPLELQVLVGGTLTDRDDVAGTPFVTGGKLEWCHRAPVRAAIERPCLLAVDEYTITPEQAGGSLMNLILARMAGDTPLHPETRVVALANHQEHAPGARRIMPSEANRLGFFTMEPKAQEVAAWFAKNRIATLQEFGLLLPHRVDLLELSPPPAKIEAGKTWASPRAWEHGLKALEACNLGFSSGKEHRIGFAALAAFVGAEQAGGYLALRSMRQRLPAFEDILAEPVSAAKSLDKRSTDVMLAALGAVPSLANSDTGAAWLWAANLPDRFLGAAVSALATRGDWTPGKWESEGRRCQMKTLSRLAGQGTGI